MNTPAPDFSPEPPEGSWLAAEYVLGVLDTAAHRSAETRAEREPAFAYEVAAWQIRLVPLIEEIAAVPAPFALWPRIQRAVNITPAGSAETTPRKPTSAWQTLSLWRWLSATGFVVAAASLAALFIATRPAPIATPVAAQTQLVATMAQDDGKPVFVATIDAASGKLVVMPIAANIPAGKVAELWLIPPGDAPHSLGLLDPQHAQPIVVPANLRGALGAKALVAVTVEPPGGAPGGKPTGPIIAKGEIALL